MDAYLGTILPVGFNYAPYGWLMCQGQILPISQYSALFSLLGINFGGNGTSNFGLPDLQGRMAMGYGDGPGLPPNNMGDEGGTASQSILTSNMPAHNHQIMCGGYGDTGTASNNCPSNLADSSGIEYYGFTNDQTKVTLTENPLALSVVGSGIPIQTLSPYLAVNFIICMSGIFPARG